MVMIRSDRMEWRGMSGWPARVLAMLAIAAADAHTQPERPVRWRVSAVREKATTGTPTRAAGIAGRLAAMIPDGWYVYALDEPAGGPTPLNFWVLNGGARLRRAVNAPEADRKADRNFNMISLVYADSVALGFVAEGVPPPAPLRVAVRFQACTDRYCLPARVDTVTASVAGVIATGDAPDVRALAIRTPLPAPSRLATEDAVQSAALTTVAEPPSFGVSHAGLGAFVWLAVTTGLLALITPCVLPMVPITVGFFTARRDAVGSHAIRDAALFALGIITSFIALGFGVSLLYGATGVVSLAANPWLNLVVAAAFLGFAAQLAGLWNISLPSALLGRATAATSAGKGALALLGMGATFSLTSFTCTAPFVGTLLVVAARGSWTWPLLGLGAYAAVFAVPFFVLALFPTVAALLPRSGPWLRSLKGVLAFLELAAVVKFVSNAAMVWGWPLASRANVLVAWALIAATLVVWLARDTVRAWRTESLRLGVARVAVVLAAASGAAFCGRGVWGAPMGELEAFLPPRGAELTTEGVSWRLNDYPASRVAAREQRRPLLIDFTGYTCTNCRWMEANMFPRPAVQVELGKFERARLYTDGDGAIYAAQQRLQERLTGSVAMPYYLVLDENGAIKQSFLGMTRDEDEFLAFLRVARTHAPPGGQGGRAR